MPRESHTTMSLTPARWSSRVTATPAAPAPEMTTRSPGSGRPRTLAPLSSPASTTIAVPCWSSWNTGMSRRSLSCSSMSKHRGAEMSSRLMPPKEGAIRTIGLDELLDGARLHDDGNGVDACEVLEEHRLALHHRHGREGADVAEAEHRRAVADDGDRVAPGRVARREARVGGDRQGHLGHPRGVEEGEVVRVAQRLRGVYPQLSTLVGAEDRALRVEERDMGGRGHRGRLLRRARGRPAASGRQSRFEVRFRGGCVSGRRAARGWPAGLQSSHSGIVIRL